METIVHYPPGEAPKIHRRSGPVSTASQICFGTDKSSFTSINQSSYRNPQTEATTRGNPQRAAGLPTNVSKQSQVIFSKDKPVYMSETGSALKTGATKSRDIPSDEKLFAASARWDPRKDSVTLGPPVNSADVLKSANQRDYISPSSREQQHQPTYSVYTSRGNFDVVSSMLYFCF